MLIGIAVFGAAGLSPAPPRSFLPRRPVLGIRLILMLAVALPWAYRGSSAAQKQTFGRSCANRMESVGVIGRGADMSSTAWLMRKAQTFIPENECDRGGAGQKEQKERAAGMAQRLSPSSPLTGVRKCKRCSGPICWCLHRGTSTAHGLSSVALESDADTSRLSGILLPGKRGRLNGQMSLRFNPLRKTG